MLLALLLLPLPDDCSIYLFNEKLLGGGGLSTELPKSENSFFGTSTFELKLFERIDDVDGWMDISPPNDDVVAVAVLVDARELVVDDVDDVAVDVVDSFFDVSSALTRADSFGI